MLKSGKSDIPISIGTTKIANEIAVNIIPSNRQFFALRGSSSLIMKYAIMPPITLKKIGKRNHRLLRFLTSMFDGGFSRI
jgi:hypothetical protein